MTWTISHPGTRHRSAAAGGSIRWPRGLAAIGLLSLLVSAWGGIVPYVGPTFGYSADGTSAWTWSLAHSLLWLVPGAVGVLAGLAVMARAGGGRLGARFSLAFWGLVLVACGAWFVLGPFAWPVLGEGTTYVTRATTLTGFVRLVGFNLGVGLVLAALGGMLLEASTGEREVLVEPNPAPAVSGYQAEAPTGRPPATTGPEGPESPQSPPIS